VPKCISASRGAVFSLPILKLHSSSELASTLERLRQDPDFAVYGSSSDSGENIRSVEKADRFALIIGNEATGMSETLTKLTDLTLTIPIQGDITSLNAACAASIMIYELTG